MTPTFVPEGLSKLHFYSYGTVAKNKDLDSHIIEVNATEDQSYIDGELDDNIEKIDADGVDHDGKSFSTTLETTNSITATWLSFTETNRMTSPDVRRGEKVCIWRFGDSDEYWWCTLQQDKKLRRLETVIYGFSNVREENTEMNASNMYWIEISTHRKIIKLHTAKNDGEPFEWSIQLDTKKGVFAIDDNDGGYFFYDAINRHFKMENKDTSYIEIDKKNAKIYTLERVDIVTKDFEIKASNSIKMTTQDYKLITQSFTTKALQWFTQVPEARFSQQLKTGAKVFFGGSSYTSGNSYARHHY
jgi:hypothetical protein